MPLQLRAKVASRARWKNHTGNQGVDPLQIRRARNLEDLVKAVTDAEQANCTVRAVGSGHSWSDVALTTGFLIETHDLRAALPLEENLLRPGIETKHLVRTEAGIRLYELNPRLEREDLALSNMGGYDAQTLAGVISTSTHGSGIDHGPIADSVRSLEVVASGGKIYRIESSAGLTDPEAFRRQHPERTLVQDDDWFYSAVVGMGCLGLIYAAIIEVEDKYWLKEVRTLGTWSDVKQQLRSQDELRRWLHYEVLLNPYPRRGDNRCLITTREKAPQPSGSRLSPPRRRNLGPEIASTLPFVPPLIDLVAGLWPGLTPRMLDRALSAIADEEYTDISYKVLNIGTANFVPAYSAEIGVPVDDRALHIKAVERIMEIAAARREIGAVYHTSPISLRFVKASPALMSMMHGQETMMIELIQMTHTEGGLEILAAYEDALYEFGGRPHWGQINTLTGSHEKLASMYPRYPDWLKVHAELNKSGVFDSPFSKRVGISSASS
jgi:hypothetical protein